MVNRRFSELYPFKSNFFKLSSGKRLHYLNEGSKDKPTIVCLHGNPTWSFYFRNLIIKLRSNYRVIAIDHLGCGLSDRFVSKDYRLKQHIENLDSLLTFLRVKSLSLVMHDWGGAIGMGWAISNQNKVNGLVFMNTAAFLSRDIPKRIALLKTPFLGHFAIKYLNVFCKAAGSMASVKPLSKDIKSAYMLPYRRAKQRGAISAFVQDIPLLASHPSYGCLNKIQDNLKNINKPTLFLWGLKDFCFHRGFLERFKEYYPHAETKVYHTAGHYLLEDESQRVPSRIKTFFESYHEYNH